MLGNTWRLVVLNNSGQTIPTNAFNCKLLPWNWSGSSIAYGAAINVVTSGDASNLSASPPANGSYGTGNAIDNSINKYLGGTLQLQVNFTSAAGVPSGSVTFYLQRSEDGGTTWPDNGNGTVVCTMSVSAKTTYTDVKEF